MANRSGSTGLAAFSGFCLTVFAIALAAAVSSQLATMSVLDPAQAESAAEEIATSRFTADIIEQTVQRAVAPIAGDDIAAQLATAASTDPQVADAISSTLMLTHRAIVDADVAAPTDGNAAVRTAIAQSMVDTATAAGFDPATIGLDVSNLDAFALQAAADQAGLPSVVPTDVPDLGLRRVAEVTRVIALVAMAVSALLAIITHPRSGYATRRLGVAGLVVCGAWLVGLLVAGWVIGLVADTLFGEMLQNVWNGAVPSMILLVGAGAVIGLGLVFAGLALDGWLQNRAVQRQW